MPSSALPKEGRTECGDRGITVRERIFERRVTLALPQRVVCRGIAGDPMSSVAAAGPSGLRSAE